MQIVYIAFTYLFISQYIIFIGPRMIGRWCVAAGVPGGGGVVAGWDGACEKIDVGIL